jgi:hypothetical protein
MNYLNPTNGYIFRITHIDNLASILQHGICAPNNPDKPEDFVNIGNPDIMSKREVYPLPLAPGGNLHDYVPFYFAPRSPMLYVNYQNPPPYQDEIIYLISKASTIHAKKLEFAFTDGHAIMMFTEYFNTLDDLDKVDWEVMKDKFWNNTLEDRDKKRRRMAEFLVKNHVPIDCIGMIAVYNEEAKTKVERILQNHSSKIRVEVRSEWYY